MIVLRSFTHLKWQCASSTCGRHGVPASVLKRTWQNYKWFASMTRMLMLYVHKVFPKLPWLTPWGCWALILAMTNLATILESKRRMTCLTGSTPCRCRPRFDCFCFELASSPSSLGVSGGSRFLTAFKENGLRDFASCCEYKKVPAEIYGNSFVVIGLTWT